jgi:hypothetical protein
MCRIKDIKIVNIKDKKKRNIDGKMPYIVACIDMRRKRYGSWKEKSL